MTYRSSALFALSLLLAPLAASGQINNGGFEDPSEVPPVLGQWQYVAGAVRDQTNPHSGLFAANLNNLAEAVNTNVQQQTPSGSITPGLEYTLSYWAQAEYGVSGVGQVQLAFLSDQGLLLPGSPQFVNIPPSAGYVSYEHNFTAPPQASAVFLGFNSVTGAVIGASAHLYVDDVSFTSDAGPGFEPADFNEDSVVDGLDLTVWAGAFGLTNGADADGDEDSDGADFLIWQQSFDPVSGGGSAVPEPACGGLAIAAMAIAGSFARRRFGARQG